MPKARVGRCCANDKWQRPPQDVAIEVITTFSEACNQQFGVDVVYSVVLIVRNYDDAVHIAQLNETFIIFLVMMGNIYYLIRSTAMFFIGREYYTYCSHSINCTLDVLSRCVY